MFTGGLIFLNFLQKCIDEHRKVCYYIIKLREGSSQERKQTNEGEKTMKAEYRILKEHTGEMINEQTKNFCFESIVLIARTYKMKRDENEYNCSYAKNAEKIYNVEVVVDGRTVHEYFGVDAELANKDWKNWKAICASEEI